MYVAREKHMYEINIRKTEVSIKNGPYKDTGYNWHNKTHDENKQNKNAQHKTKNM
jgi:hypothetical protein